MVRLMEYSKSPACWVSLPGNGGRTWLRKRRNFLNYLPNSKAFRLLQWNIVVSLLMMKIGAWCRGVTGLMNLQKWKGKSVRVPMSVSSNCCFVCVPIPIGLQCTNVHFLSSWPKATGKLPRNMESSSVLPTANRWLAMLPVSGNEEGKGLMIMWIMLRLFINSGKTV